MKHVAVGDLGVGQILKESFILVDCNITLFSVPNSAKRVDNLSVEFDGVRDKLRELLDNLLDLNFLGELTRLRKQLKNNSSSSLEVKVIDIRDFIRSRAIGYPSYS